MWIGPTSPHTMTIINKGSAVPVASAAYLNVTLHNATCARLILHVVPWKQYRISFAPKYYCTFCWYVTQYFRQVIYTQRASCWQIVQQGLANCGLWSKMVEKRRLPGWSFSDKIIKHTWWLKCTLPANLRFSRQRDSSSPSSYVWMRVTGHFVPDLQVCSTFNFKGRKSKKKKTLAYNHWRWNRCIISKRREPIITWCAVVPQKNWNVSYGDYLWHKCDSFSVVGWGRKCLTVCAPQQPYVIQTS